MWVVEGEGKSHRRALMVPEGGTAPLRLKLAGGRVCLENRECAENVRGMRKWKTAITRCY